MPIQFKQVAPLKLNIDTGAVTDQSGQSIAPKPAPASIGMDTQEFHNQVMQLANNKTPLEKVHQAIEAHPDITDKDSAKEMAGAIYQIMGKPVNLKGVDGFNPNRGIPATYTSKNPPDLKVKQRKPTTDLRYTKNRNQLDEGGVPIPGKSSVTLI